MRFNKVCKIKAFTLAEILITLSIIGVIASMTIPSLIQDVQDAQFKTAWKKAYSDLDQATKMVLLNNGGNFKGLCGNNNDCLLNLYLPYLNYIKSCNNAASAGNCWHQAGNSKLLNNSTMALYNFSGIVLNSGGLILFWFNDSTCQLLRGSPAWKQCGQMLYDVNGFKGPNIAGKDIFNIWIAEDSIKPVGTQGDGYQNTCISSSSGWGCAAKYLMQ